jgi:hypothetical protein
MGIVSRAAKVATVLAFVGGAARGQDYSAALDSGLTSSDKDLWYRSTQGSRLVPEDWLRALEQPGTGQKKFLDDEHRRALRYLPGEDGLPLGFAIDNQDDRKLPTNQLRWKNPQSPAERWVGMTCAACHTGRITFQGKSMIVEGGSTNADFQKFIEDFNLALTETKSDAAKFDRFAKGVLKANDTPANRALLATALDKLLAYQLKIAMLNKTGLRYGFGRLDAVGNILNKVSLLSGAPNPKPNPADAPVSYPFLWNTTQQDYVEWNGLAEAHKLPGFDIGALGRNAGEVIGVFGHVETKPSAELGFVSSVHVTNLVALSLMTEKIRPPKWPVDALGKIEETDPATKWQRGAEVYNSAGCSDCHKLLANRLDTSPIKVTMVPLLPPASPWTKMTVMANVIGTDPWMACNTTFFSSAMGNFKGLTDPLSNQKLGDSGPLANALGAVVKQTLINHPGEVGLNAIAGFVGVQPLPKPVDKKTFWTNIMEFNVEGVKEAVGLLSDKEQRRKDCFDPSNPPANRKVLAYKARPLNGIWATAPYLHNGSVSSLYELLTPAAKRKSEFYLGTYEYNVRDGGYITDKGPDNTFRFDTTLEGNSKAGHEYGTTLSENDKRALINYLKML